MRGVLAIPAAAVLLVACSTTPVYLTDLEAEDYTDADSVMNQLDCTSHTVIFHIGQGVSNEQEAIEAARDESAGDVTTVITRAEQRGVYIWVLATEAGQVIGVLDSRGGVALCVQSVEAAVPLRPPTSTPSVIERHRRNSEIS